MNYDWGTLIGLPIIAAIIIGLIFTLSLTKSVRVRVLSVILAIFLVGFMIFQPIWSTLHPDKTNPTILPISTAPFTYDPGETTNGVITFPGNASSFTDQYTCALRGSNAEWLDSKCLCKVGYYGSRCEYQGFSAGYVSLTTTTPVTVTFGPSTTMDNLTVWPNVGSTTGCTNNCDLSTSCLGVTYSGNVCTQITSLSFTSGPPIQSDMVLPVLPSTLYLKKNSLSGVDMVNYYNVISGSSVPVRYFAGNGFSYGANSNIITTTNGIVIRNFLTTIDYTVSGVPDFVIVNFPGFLYISTSRISVASIPFAAPNPTTIKINTPVTLTKQNFPFSDNTISYHILATR